MAAKANGGLGTPDKRRERPLPSPEPSYQATTREIRPLHERYKGDKSIAFPCWARELEAAGG